MTIIVLGAAGDMGRGVLEQLRASGSEAVAADRDPEGLAAVREAFGCGTELLDVTDGNAGERLRALGGDVLVSAVGPFYRFGVRTLELAIEAGLDYVDVCDDHDATETQLERHGAARRAGVTAAIGCGWTPGVSNLLAKAGVEEVGGRPAVSIHWVGSAADSRGMAVIEHLLHVSAGEVPQFEGSVRVPRRAGSGGGWTALPEVGPVWGALCGHPEPLTIPGHLGVASVTVRGGLTPAWQNRLIRLLVSLGAAGTSARIRWTSRILHGVEGPFRLGGPGLSGVRVDVEGESSVSYAATGPMRRLTGWTAALCARRLQRGGYDAGVWPPEAVFEPGAILGPLIGGGISFYRRDGERWLRLEGFS